MISTWSSLNIFRLYVTVIFWLLSLKKIVVYVDHLSICFLISTIFFSFQTSIIEGILVRLVVTIDFCVDWISCILFRTLQLLLLLISLHLSGSFYFSDYSPNQPIVEIPLVESVFNQYWVFQISLIVGIYQIPVNDD